MTVPDALIVNCANDTPPKADVAELNTESLTGAGLARIIVLGSMLNAAALMMSFVTVADPGLRKTAVADWSEVTPEMVPPLT